MIIRPIFWNSLFIDLSPLLWLWAASALKEHSATARKWTIGISGLYLAGCILIALDAAITGTSHMTITIGGRIPNPAPWQVLLVAGGTAAVASVPFVMLLTARARRQFDKRFSK